MPLVGTQRVHMQPKQASLLVRPPGVLCWGSTPCALSQRRKLCTLAAAHTR